MEDIEELDEDLCEITTETRFDLEWTCPNCKEDNVEYDVCDNDNLKCECGKCNKVYSYYVQLY